MRSTVIRAFVLCAVGFLIAAAVLHSWRVEQTPRYNVVVISVDSLRADHMGTYGYARTTTPNIDRFADGAVVFESYFATSHLTPVSEASVHTGVYPIINGVVNFETSLKDDVPTLAEVLQDGGWSTGAFGSSQEFQYYPAMRASFMRGFDTYAIHSDFLDQPWLGRGMLDTDKALAWAQRQVDTQTPFFLWLTVGSAHWPYGEDEPHHFSDSAYAGPLADSAATAGNSVPALFNFKYGTVFDGKIFNGRKQIVASDASRDIAYARDRYDDGLVMTDRKIAPVLDFLSRPGIAANTIVIIESEHGEGFGEHGYIAHYDIWDTETHTPLIIKIPTFTPRRVSGLASGVDILPTILDALRLPPPSPVDGVNLLGSMKKRAKSPRTEVLLARTPLWERLIATSTAFLAPFVEEDNTNHQYDTALRTQKWKLIHRLSRHALDKYSWYGHLTGQRFTVPEYELYDIQMDPEEQHDVYTEHGGDSDVAALRAKLENWEADLSAALPAPHRPPEEVQPYF